MKTHKIKRTKKEWFKWLNENHELTIIRKLYSIDGEYIYVQTKE